MLNKMKSWIPSEEWLKITTIDAHTAGEPFRVVTGGYPDLPGDTILARRRYAKGNLDHLRTALMWEPRGHADMYGCIVTPPVSPEADRPRHHRHRQSSPGDRHAAHDRSRNHRQN
jgi:trans-L-3-hydroxyproline dehydratase